MRTVLGFAILCLVGCGGPEVTRITGSVLVEDRPVVGDSVSVLFWPETDLGLGVMTAYGTQEEGMFDIRPDPKQGQGRAGEYKVVIYRESGLAGSLKSAGNPKEMKAKVTKAAGQARIPHVYGDDSLTPLRATISPGENNLAPFNLEKTKPTRR